ncbi:MAG: RNA polymerase sigma factor [Parvibaculaceae bacterium]
MGVDIRLQIVTMLPRLRRFARSLAGHPDRADDLVQATCERALRGMDGWQPGSRLDSWLYRIMQNLWIDDMRKRRTQGIEEPVEQAFDLAGDDGERQVQSRLAAAEAIAALGRLPEDQRTVISLVCIEELSYREVASILDIPIGTVMSRLARGRRALGDMLGLAEPEVQPRT